MDSRPALLIASRRIRRLHVSPATKPLRFALLGTGFWARYQLGAWRELPGARCVALYNRTRAKAEALGRELGIGAVYDDAEELLRREDVDFLDVVTDPSTHARFVDLAVAHGKPVICQKPMANDLATAERMVHACRESASPSSSTRTGGGRPRSGP